MRQRCLRVKWNYRVNSGEKNLFKKALEKIIVGENHVCEVLSLALLSGLSANLTSGSFSEVKKYMTVSRNALSCGFMGLGFLHFESINFQKLSRRSFTENKMRFEKQSIKIEYEIVKTYTNLFCNSIGRFKRNPTVDIEHLAVIDRGSIDRVCEQQQRSGSDQCRLK